MTETSTAGSPAATTPRSIHADREARTLTVEWRDEHRTVYDFVALRWLCPCAYCRGEAGLPGWLDSRPTLTDQQTRMVDIHLVGNYAVAPEWGDGHHTGFYTFAVLRDRCPCDECTARRVNRDEGGTVGGHLGHTRHADHTEQASPPAVTDPSHPKETR